MHHQHQVHRGQAQCAGLVEREGTSVNNALTGSGPFLAGLVDNQANVHVTVRDRHVIVRAREISKACLE